MLRYASLQNWTIGQLLLRLDRSAEPIHGSIPSEWVTNTSEAEIRDAAALSGVSQLEISPMDISQKLNRPASILDQRLLML